MGHAEAIRPYDGLDRRCATAKGSIQATTRYCRPAGDPVGVHRDHVRSFDDPNLVGRCNRNGPTVQTDLSAVR